MDNPKLKYVLLGNLSQKTEVGEYPQMSSEQVNTYFLPSTPKRPNKYSVNSVRPTTADSKKGSRSYLQMEISISLPHIVEVSS